MSARDSRLAGARAVVRRITERERKHLQLCAQCHLAGADVYKRCGDGWQLSKELARAKYAAGEAETRASRPAGQGELW